MHNFSQSKNKFGYVYILTTQGVAEKALEMLEALEYHFYAVACPERDALQAHLKELGVRSLIYYPVSLHYKAPCKALQYGTKRLRAREILAAQCLLPPYRPQMTEADIYHVMDTVNSFKTN